MKNLVVKTIKIIPKKEKEEEKKIIKKPKNQKQVKNGQQIPNSEKIFKKMILKKIGEKKMPEEEKNIFLVLPNEEISLGPELSRPPRFRIQGGQPERDTGGGAGAGQDSLLLILDYTSHMCYNFSP